MMYRILINSGCKAIDASVFERLLRVTLSLIICSGFKSHSSSVLLEAGFSRVICRSGKSTLVCAHCVRGGLVTFCSLLVPHVKRIKMSKLIGPFRARLINLFGLLQELFSELFVVEKEETSGMT